MTPVLCFVGASGVGKTTLLERVVPHLKSRGYRVAVVKHAAHGFDLDQPGKDSWRLTKAGSNIVVLTSTARMATIEEVKREPSLAEIALSLKDKVDIIIAEGFKNEPCPKIEIYRSQVSDGLFSEADELVAVVSDCPLPTMVPQLGFEDIESIVELILGAYLSSQWWPLSYSPPLLR